MRGVHHEKHGQTASRQKAQYEWGLQGEKTSLKTWETTTMTKATNEVKREEESGTSEAEEKNSSIATLHPPPDLVSSSPQCFSNASHTYNKSRVQSGPLDLSWPHFLLLSSLLAALLARCPSLDFAWTLQACSHNRDWVSASPSTGDALLPVITEIHSLGSFLYLLKYHLIRETWPDHPRQSIDTPHPLTLSPLLCFVFYNTSLSPPGILACISLFICSFSVSPTEDKFHELYMLDYGWLRSIGPMQLNRAACPVGHSAWFMSLLLLSWNSSQFYLLTCEQYIQSKVTMGYAQRRGWAEEILWTTACACACTAVIQQPRPQAQSAWPFDVHAHTAGLSRVLCGLGSRARMSLRSLTVTATTAAKAAVAVDVGGSNSRTPGGRRACPSILGDCS